MTVACMHPRSAPRAAHRDWIALAVIALPCLVYTIDLTVLDVATTDAVGPLSPRILGKDEGLLCLGLDETVEGRDLNGDGDATDTNVLALMDGTVTTGHVHSTGLAMPAGTPVFRARRTSTSSHDWQVGFLVSEAAQDATNLNNPALFSGTWKPSQCVGDEDADARRRTGSRHWGCRPGHVVTERRPVASNARTAGIDHGQGTFRSSTGLSAA